MEGKPLYKCKSLCVELGNTCHNTKNRVIEKLCDCEDSHKKTLASFLKCLMVMECLCNYLNCCCCEHESLSSHSLSELKLKCSKISTCCGNIKKHMSKDVQTYLNCEKIVSLCSQCKQITTKHKQSKKKLHKAN
jgi:hypothetical protein